MSLIFWTYKDAETEATGGGGDGDVVLGNQPSFLRKLHKDVGMLRIDFGPGTGGTPGSESLKPGSFVVSLRLTVNPSIAKRYSPAISHNAVVVFQFRVVAATESLFSKALFESFVFPYPSGQ